MLFSSVKKQKKKHPIMFAMMLPFILAHFAKAEAVSHQDMIKIYNGVLRLSSMEQDRASGFFVIKNDGNSDRLLQGISAPICQDIVANHSNQEPINARTGVQKNIFHNLVIPQHSTMVFPEGGYHFVCHGFAGNMKVGEKVKFIFHFDGNDDMAAEFLISANKE